MFMTEKKALAGITASLALAAILVVAGCTKNEGEDGASGDSSVKEPVSIEP